MSKQEVDTFFSQYRDAFNRFDGDAVADLWHAQSAISHPAPRGAGAQVTQWASDEPMRSNQHALCKIYADRPAHTWQFDVLQHTPLGPDQAFANLRWTACTSGGGATEQFQTGYLLIRSAQGVRVAHCVQYEEKSERAKSA